MSKKNNKIQQFTTLDLLLAGALASVALVTVGSILWEVSRDNRRERARLGAEALVQQMVAGGLGFAEKATESSADSSRRFASADNTNSSETGAVHPTLPTLFDGKIGKDPWGRPFHYRLLRTVDGQPLRIWVWSDGPNQRDDSPMSEKDVLNASLAAAVDGFAGDDIGSSYHANYPRVSDH